MSTNVTFNGSTYAIPAEGDSGWGTVLSNYFIAIASGTLQKSGGTFTLTAEANFGATYGLKTAYLKSQAANPASAGIFRLGNDETISWRNAANGGDVSLKVNASDALQFNGANILTAGGGLIVNADVSAGAAIDYSKLNLTGLIVNADIAAAAAIAYSKLSLTGSIVNADVAALAAIDYSKLNLAGSILNADINAAAAIAYSKLSLTGSIVNADIGAAAAIAYSKLAALTASRALVSDVSGVVSVSATTSTEVGYLSGVTSAIQTQINAKAPSASPTFTGTVTTPLTASRAVVTGASSELAASAATATEVGYLSGVTSAIQTQLDGKTLKSTLSAKGSIYAATAASTPADLAVGTDGQVLTADSASAAGVKWATAAASPTSSYELSNLGLSVSVAANALTIALKQADGTTDPSTGASAVKVGFRSSTVTEGLYNQRSVTSALSLVVPSGATLGSANNVAQEYFVYLLDNAGTVELAVSSTYYPDKGPRFTTQGENGIFTATTAIDTASDAGDVIYSTTARTNIPFRLIGRFNATEATAGTWATTPSSVTLVPFEFKGYNVNTSTAAAFVTSGVYRSLTDANIPLTPGVYELGGRAAFYRNGGTSNMTSYTAYWSQASGAATAFSGTNITRLTGNEEAAKIGFNVTQELDVFNASMTSIIVQVKNAATVYAVDRVEAGTPANFTSQISLYVKRLQ